MRGMAKAMRWLYEDTANDYWPDAEAREEHPCHILDEEGG